MLLIRAVEIILAAGERWTTNDGDVAGDVVGRRTQPWRALAFVDGDDDRRRGRTRLRRSEHPCGRHYGTWLLRKRQAHDDGPRDRTNSLQLSIRQRGQVGTGRIPEVSTHRNLLLVLPYANTLHHRSRTVS